MVDSRPLERPINADVVTRAAVLNAHYAAQHGYDFAFVKHGNFTPPTMSTLSAEDVPLHGSPFAMRSMRIAKRAATRHVRHGWKRSASWAKLPVIAAALLHGRYSLVICMDTDAFFHSQALGWTEWLRAHPSVPGATQALDADLAFFGARPVRWISPQTCGVIAIRNTPTARALLRFWWDSWSATHGENYYEQNTMTQMVRYPDSVRPFLPPGEVADRMAAAERAFTWKLPVAIVETPIQAIISTTHPNCRQRYNCHVVNALKDNATCADYWVCHLTNLGWGMRVRLLNDSLRVNMNGASSSAVYDGLLARRAARVTEDGEIVERPLASHVYVQLNSTRCAEAALEKPGFGGGPYDGYCVGDKGTKCMRHFGVHLRHPSTPTSEAASRHFRYGR